MSFDPVPFTKRFSSLGARKPAYPDKFRLTKPRTWGGSSLALADTISSACMDLDATQTASYPGTGFEWFNLVESPNDGKAQSDYDCYIGSDGVGTDAPTFDTDHFVADGSQIITIQSDVSSGFLNNITNYSTSNPFWFAVSVYIPDPLVHGDYVFDVDDGTQRFAGQFLLLSGVPVLRIRFENTFELAEAGNIQEGAWNLIVITGDQSTFTLKTAINSKVWSPVYDTDVDNWRQSTSNAMGAATMSFMAQTSGSSDLGTGYLFKSAHGGNSLMTETELAAFVTLMNTRHTATYARSGATPDLQTVEPSACWYIDVTQSDCFNGSGTTLSNLITSPADGESQTDYDFEIFDNGSGLPTLVGTAGDVTARLDLGVDTPIRIKSLANATMLNTMHQSNAGNGYWIALVADGYLAYEQTTAQDALFGNTDGVSDRGVLCYTGTAGNPHFAQANDSGNDTRILNTANPNKLQNNVPCVLLVTWEASSNGVKGFFNHNEADTAQSLTFQTITDTITAAGNGASFYLCGYDDGSGTPVVAAGAADRDQTLYFIAAAGGNDYLTAAEAGDVIQHLGEVHTRWYMDL